MPKKLRLQSSSTTYYSKKKVIYKDRWEVATLYRPIYLDPIGSDTYLKDGQADVSYTPILSSTTNRESEGFLARNRTLAERGS